MLAHTPSLFPPSPSMTNGWTSPSQARVLCSPLSPQSPPTTSSVSTRHRHEVGLGIRDGILSPGTSEILARIS